MRRGGVAKGVYPRKAPGVCMVAGCSRKALYQNGGTQARGRAGGYCSEHKALAVSAKTENPGLLRWMDKMSASDYRKMSASDYLPKP